MRFLIAFLMLFIFNQVAFAKGVKAATVIESMATLSYSIGEKKELVKSNVSKIVVAQLIDLVVSWSDLDEVVVNSGEKFKILSFRVKNIGNGKDKISLLGNILKYKSDFLPKGVSIYIDENDNLNFDSKDRQKKSLELEADEEKMVYLVCDIEKKRDLKSSDKSYIALKAVSLTGGSGIKGKVHKNSGIDGVDAVDGLSGGVGEDVGILVYKDINLDIKKELNYDPKSGLITVLLHLSSSNSGSFKDVNVDDFIPKQTMLVDGSLMFDDRTISRCKSDIYKGSKRLSLDIGDIDSSQEHTITYKLKIKKG